MSGTVYYGKEIVLQGMQPPPAHTPTSEVKDPLPLTPLHRNTGYQLVIGENHAAPWSLYLNGVLVARAAFAADKNHPDEFWHSDIPEDHKQMILRQLLVGSHLEQRVPLK